MPTPSGAFAASVGASGPQFEDASLQQSIAHTTRPSVDHPLSAYLGFSRSKNASSTTKSSAHGVLPHPCSSTVRRHSKFSVLVDSIRMTRHIYCTNSVVSCAAVLAHCIGQGARQFV